MRRFACMAAVLLVAGAGLSACKKDHPKTLGQKIDKAGEDIRDTVDPPKGPVEKAGREVDRTLDK
ncbi:hypothetical protein LOC54_09225 [Acetobacter sp. AN02]|uniref:hypothetical protein n=1 Tax=Acetobacter sp. AN02 TaxID=2894186 RepID=UPI0024344781|nr:hypothetical protein [Acetobacter sp. AN02]MDG6095282.1 hypothetical protein [Acetobacter sp. AN02]